MRIDSETQYETILVRIEELMEKTDDSTPISDSKMIELDFLASEVEAYEAIHIPY